MHYTKENIKEGIVNKIESSSEFSDSTKRMLKVELLEYPKEVEQNVLEWLNNEPITDVDCHGESIRRVMDVLELDDNWFPVILRNFIKFKYTNFLMDTKVFEGLE